MKSVAFWISGCLGGVLLALSGCQKEKAASEAAPAMKQEVTTGINAPVTETTSHGAGLRIKAKLVEVPGPFPANDLYNYVYVMRYQVLAVQSGKFNDADILVGQYNPRIPRAEIKDDKDSLVDGNVIGFEVGDEQVLTLRPLDSVYTGALEDEFYQDKRSRWFATITNRP